MKKKAILITAIAISFGFGFGFKTILTNQSSDQKTLKRVTGIGGIFFKCKNPKNLREWYQKHPGLNTNQYGTVFEWRQRGDTRQNAIVLTGFI